MNLRVMVLSSGFIHLTTFIAMASGIVLGSWLAQKLKSWDIFFFSLALLIGWIIHVILYDSIVFFFEHWWDEIWVARGGRPWK